MTFSPPLKVGQNAAMFSFFQRGFDLAKKVTDSESKPSQPFQPVSL
jgi:hypothetical protein